MTLYLPLAVIGLVLASAGSVHPEPYDRGPAPFQTVEPVPAPSPAEGTQRMVCVIDTPFPDHQERCPTRPGYPGSPCRCEGALFDGERVVVD